MINIGVLALQGAFREHAAVLERLGAAAIEVRLPEDLNGCSGLILPGGETTTQRKLAKAYGLWEPLRKFGDQGLPMLATCAGTILLAKKVDCLENISLDLLDIDVLRNAYGRQVHSFETLLPPPCLEADPCPSEPFPAIFIRAPRITRVGSAVTVLGYRDKEPVAVRQGNILGLVFHPELTPDDRFHRYFLNIVQQQ